MYFNIKCIRKGATMKKRLIRVMSSLMFVCLLAGCGSKSSSGNAVSEAPSKNEGTESVAEVADLRKCRNNPGIWAYPESGHALAIAPEELRLWWKKVRRLGSSQYLPSAN